MGLGWSKPTTKYDWKPDLQDYREEYFRYNHVNKYMDPFFSLSKNFSPLARDNGSSAANAIASILDGYGIKYHFKNGSEKNVSAKNVSAKNGSASNVSASNVSASNVSASIKGCWEQIVVDGWHEMDEKKSINDMSVEELKEMNRRLCEPVPKLDKIYNFRNQLKMSINEGYPVIFGFSVYESFEEALITGKLTKPGPDEKMLGGMCGVIMGWDDEDETWIVRVGDLEGHVISFPYNYITQKADLVNDFWRINI